MAGELDALRAEGGTRIIIELLVAMVVLYAFSVVAVIPALKSVAPDLFAGAVDYGRYNSSVPDKPLDWAHVAFNVGSFLAFLHWRLNHTTLGQRFTESYRQQR